MAKPKAPRPKTVSYRLPTAQAYWLDSFIMPDGLEQRIRDYVKAKPPTVIITYDEVYAGVGELYYASFEDVTEILADGPTKTQTIARVEVILAELGLKLEDVTIKYETE
jgi:hypothetical protein